jgi:hypothetical protein
LSQGTGVLRIPAGRAVCIEVSTQPVELGSPVAYLDPPTRKERLLLAEGIQAGRGDEDEIEYEEEDEHEDDDDLTGSVREEGE